MIKKLNICEEKTAKKVFSLQRIAYRVEAKMIGSDDIPPLKESLSQLKMCGENFLGFFINEELAGVLSYKRFGNQLDIHRVMVHPNHFRKGIGEKLVCYVEELENSAREVIVSTGKDNIPAVRLYEKLGFKKTGETIASNGIALVLLRKMKAKEGEC